MKSNEYELSIAIYLTKHKNGIKKVGSHEKFEARNPEEAIRRSRESYHDTVNYHQRAGILNRNKEGSLVRLIGRDYEFSFREGKILHEDLIRKL